jgi:putative phosphoesterase
MKIGILSDTHDNIDNIKKAANIFSSLNIELMIHLGDFVAPFTAQYFSDINIKFIGIFGNNDGEKFGLKKAFSNIGDIYSPPYELLLEEKNFLLLHDPITLDAYIKSQKYDYILYGHLHKKDKRTIGKTAIFNPGEVCGIVSGVASIGYIDTKKDIMEIIDL